MRAFFLKWTWQLGYLGKHGECAKIPISFIYVFTSIEGRVVLFEV
jgi:hypothetical protein